MADCLKCDKEIVLDDFYNDFPYGEGIVCSNCGAEHTTDWDEDADGSMCWWVTGLKVDRSGLAAVCVDLDGTLVRWEASGFDVNAIGRLMPGAKEFMERLYKKARVIIYTCRTNALLENPVIAAERTI